MNILVLGVEVLVLWMGILELGVVVEALPEARLY